jgi:hypothetical protein
MADTTFRIVLPALKAIDNGDGTYSMAIEAMPDIVGADTTFVGVIPPLKAKDNGDGTFSLLGILQ